MMGKGRPIKPGQRDKYGKRTLDARQEEIRRTAIEGRMNIYGVSRELAGRDVMGSPLQRLQHWKIITPAQADAGYDFALTLRDYLSTGKLQRPTQGKAGFILSAPDNGEGPAVRGEVKARAYMEALAEIDRADPYSAPTTTSVVWDVCINEGDRLSDAEIGALRVGLNAIHRILYGRRAA